MPVRLALLLLFLSVTAQSSLTAGREAAPGRRPSLPPRVVLQRNAVPDDRAVPRRAHQGRGGHRRVSRTSSTSASSTAACGRRPTTAASGRRSSTTSRPAPSARSRSRRRIPNVIYVGSGEGLQRPDLSTGDGIYKSTDAGKTWTHLGLRDGQQIPQIVVDPRDPNRLFVAVLGPSVRAERERGMFRSTDGGETFQKVLYKDENTGAIDVVLDPVEPADRLRRAVGSAAGAVGERRVRRAGQRLSSSRPTAARRGGSSTNGLPTFARRWTGPHRHRRRAERSDARLFATVEARRATADSIAPTTPARTGRRVESDDARLAGAAATSPR